MLVIPLKGFGTGADIPVAAASGLKQRVLAGREPSPVSRRA
jgi:hypothetical protein